MFGNLSDRLTASFQSLRGKGRLTDADIDATVSEIRRALLEADVALPVVRSFTSAVRDKAKEAVRSQVLNPTQQVVKIVNDELVEVLGGATREISWADRGPTVIMLAGLQGAGKTTLAGKLGKWLKGEGRRVLLVASDLQRPNAVTQLSVVAERAGVDVWAPEPGNGVGDPVHVARTGVEQARANGYDVVVVDTAGRLGVDAEMMDQAVRIRDAVQPHEILFVLDAMVGQDAVNTSIAFRDGVGFTGVVLSKLDGDARGGAALSVRGVTGAPVLFSSTGEGLDDFERFHADRMASRILDMGDLLTLIEQAQRAFDEKEAEEAAAKMASGTFTLEDFLAQLRQVRKMGSMKKLLGMMPGMGQMREALENFDEREVDRVEAIVCSMTPAERRDLSILNGSRRARIAKGSGTSVQAVNELVTRFEAAKKMMEAMTAGGLGENGMMPGMGSLPSMGKRAKARQAPKAKQGKGGRKGRSGNPAKAARQAREAAARGRQEPEAPAAPVAGSAFGLGGAGQAAPGGYGIMPGQQGAADSDDVASAMSALPEDLRRTLGL
ncbi:MULTISPECIES: signal recognition particle protein [unclassified Actinomyces]|uniref:signal recognition particle protein n=1 Tax=unclassified Actinomyces TaxID=2609248 RepID=UPI0020180411|nr:MULTISPECIES: signal recognition particle protein [unclassified Actinomyces]MCL3778618.1 signal recognition particle protein [Actinomyces sp. AC-20-1]MCL3789940.1 signal recognition particle protein [Actinomyces sp. 187325]MCL3792156.1 signal recognition particle protein [Actinomyces sp. 186855]MCL3794886.1 signal recognition particle protein [Actinomyces sp. 217892]